MVRPCLYMVSILSTVVQAGPSDIMESRGDLHPHEMKDFDGACIGPYIDVEFHVDFRYASTPKEEGHDDEGQMPVHGDDMGDGGGGIRGSSCG